jgi:hypothetical protein
LGELVHINFGESLSEEYMEVLAVNPAAQAFTAVFTKNHSLAR